MDGTTNLGALDTGPEWTDIMVDVETTGTAIDRTAIIQISAVKFNLHKGTVCHEFFDRCLTIPPHRFWDQATASWWSQQKASVLQDILRRAEPWQNVIKDLGTFSYQNPGLRFWSKPTHFDHSFISSYFKDADLPNPFHYRIARDLNSYLEGLFYPNAVPDHIANMPFSGEVHNALDDTLHQLGILLEAVKYKKEQSE